MNRWMFYAGNGKAGTLLSTSAAVGDGVVLWRSGTEAGVIAIGTVVSIHPVKDEWAAIKRRVHEPPEPDPEDEPLAGHFATPSYDHILLSNPLTIPALRDLGLDEVSRRGRVGIKSFRRPPDPERLDLDKDMWDALVAAAERQLREPCSRRAWAVEPGEVLYRSDVHEAFGGVRHSAECTSARLACDLLFVSDRQEDPLLVPRWSRDLLLVPGQPQIGSSEDQSGSTMVCGHLHRGRPLHLFQARGKKCRYIGEFVIDQDKPIEGWMDAGRRRIRKTRNRFDIGLIAPEDLIASAPEEPGLLRDFRVPLLRLRQLNGVAAFGDVADPFEGAVARSLGLRTYLDTGQDPGLGELGGVGELIRGLMRLFQQQPALAAATENLDELQALAALTENARRRADLDGLRKVVADPASKEHDLQKAVERMPWIFGGQFLPKLGRRNLTATDQLDLALIRPDGSLHGVELKQANITALIRGDHSSSDHPQYVVGAKVSAAIGQAMNYLRHLDEERDHILATFGIDARRASMTVVIGATGFVSLEDRPFVAETLRTWNACLSRVQVVTYDQLIEEAARAYALADAADTADCASGTDVDPM